MTEPNIVHETYISLNTHGYKPAGADKVNINITKQGTPCGFFEMQYMRCMEAFGSKLGRKYCDFEFRDFKECVTNNKQKARAYAIRSERWKQWLAGERKTPYEQDHYKYGNYEPHYFSYSIHEDQK
uniref:NADH dehydrogenase [ubiquinone] iron-sulfur protein 5 n=1 Tax=Ditylenchus dipsaci TaxID=166011 RepID=A0A915E479_9BILA